ncbi:hypothetical protein MHYP_G00313600 [Metynnis hypsauchen]
MKIKLIHREMGRGFILEVCCVYLSKVALTRRPLSAVSCRAERAALPSPGATSLKQDPAVSSGGSACEEE